MISRDAKAKRTIFFQSLGCPKNLVDTEVMLGIAQSQHYEAVRRPEDAAIIVVNTCSFIEASKRESIEAILDLSKNKETGRCERLIVAGCLPQRYKADLKVALPEVDAFIGTGQYGQLVDFIEGLADSEEDFKHPRYIHSEHTPRINSQPFYRAYLKISEGCIKNCAFCIIPKIRGTLRSRTIRSLVEEARRLVDSGVLELNLIAQDLTDYGRDLRDGTDLLQLLRSLSKVDGLRWIRMLYVYPDEFSDELLEFVAGEPKVCKYIDMPVQHINDRMLRLMNRKVSGHQIRTRVERIRNRVPQVSIRSTVIVGYPGETTEEFKELHEFIGGVGFEHLGVFTYSREEMTASYSLPTQLPQELKDERRHELMSLQQSISRERLQRKVGQTLEVIVEGPSEESELLWRGRHEGQAPEIDGCVLIRRGRIQLGTMANVRIERAMEYELIGSVIGGP